MVYKMQDGVLTFKNDLCPVMKPSMFELTFSDLNVAKKLYFSNLSVVKKFWGQLLLVSTSLWSMKLSSKGNMVNHVWLFEEK